MRPHFDAQTGWLLSIWLRSFGSFSQMIVTCNIICLSHAYSGKPAIAESLLRVPTIANVAMRS